MRTIALGANVFRHWVNPLAEGGELVKTSTTSKSWKKIRVPGFVTLFHDGGTGFRIRYQETTTGRDIRRTIPADTLENARTIVDGYNAEIAVGRSVPGMKAKAEHGLSVREALVEAVRAMGGDKRVKADYTYTANAFRAWLMEHYPAVHEWSDVRPSMIKAWVESSKDKVAHATLANRLKPIRHVSSYWAAEFPGKYQDVVKAARIKLQRPPANPVPALDANQLLSFLDWLKKNAPALHTMAVVCGLTGLRMKEAAYLRYCDIDFAAGTITVAKTLHHTPKTRSSYRIIPVCGTVLQALRKHTSQAAVVSIDPEGEIFLHSKGRPWGHGGLIGAWRDAMKVARQSLDLPGSFKARNLRASFVTLATRAGSDYRALRRYVGHTPGDMLGEHYQHVSVADLKANVVDVFEDFLAEKWQSQNADS